MKSGTPPQPKPPLKPKPTPSPKPAHSKSRRDSKPDQDSTSMDSGKQEAIENGAVTNVGQGDMAVDRVETAPKSPQGRDESVA